MTRYDQLLKMASQSTDDCIDWPHVVHYGKSKTIGYGRLTHKGKNVRAHRVVCSLYHGEPPFEGAQAAHKCDRGLCVNPQHLYWASPVDNTLDRVRNGTTKLGVADVRMIRDLYATGQWTQRGLGDLWGVDQVMISLIVTRKSWAHVA